VNHCRTPACPNFAVPASTQPVAPHRPPAGSVGTGDGHHRDVTPKGAPALVCQTCDVLILVKSNQGIQRRSTASRPIFESRGDRPARPEDAPTAARSSATIQHYLTYTAALMTNTAQRDAAEGFIKFLVSPEAKSTLAANGVN
jgi:Bacterial extracellular solute-binding protein